MVSPHFPPDTSAGTHRVRILAPHLRSHGWDPTVVTVKASGYEGRLDPDLAALVPTSLRVIRAPALPVSWTRYVGLGDLGLRALPGLLRVCRGLLRDERFDALFITIYPTYPALLGPFLKRWYRVPFVLDYQDPWVGAWGRDVGGGPGGAPDLKSRASRALAMRLEPAVVRAADAITAVSSRTYEDVLRRVPDARPTMCAGIPIGFDADDMTRLRAAPRPNRWFSQDDGLVHVCYVGTILPTGFEVLRAVLAGLAVVRDRSPESYRRLRVHFLGTSNQRVADGPVRVVPIAAQMGVGDVVTEEAPRLDYLDALNVQAQADALLLLGSTEPHYTASKVFSALLSGRPMLAVCHEASSVVDILANRPGTEVLTFGSDEPARLVPRIAAAWEAFASGGARAETPSAVDPDDAGRIRQWSAQVLAGELSRVLDAVA